MKKLLSITLSIIMLISAMAFIAPTPARAETLAQNTPTMRALRADELSPYVDATTALSHGHVARVPAEEDLNTIVYRNLDGTKTAYFFDYNVKYVDENGATKDKDITLANKAGGFGLTQSDISLTIPTDITNGVEFTHNGNYIKLTPLRETIIEESLSSSAAALNKPQSAVKDTTKNEISYQKAFGNNTSLRYVPTMEGIKEEIILSSYTGTTAWRFLATTNGLTSYKDASGIYYFATAEDSDERYSLGEVYTYDSVGNYTYGTMTVTEVKPAQQYIITLNVDEDFLTVDSTVYPVYVDPTLTITNNGIIDTEVYSKTPTTNNYYLDQYMAIGYNYDSATDYGIGRVVMRAQSLINNYTFYYSMDNISSATLTLYFDSVVPNAPISIHRVTNTTWTESDATWNTVGNAFDSSYTLKTFTPVSGANNIDVTSIVSSWRANENYLRGGLLLKMTNEPTTNSYHLLKSGEEPTGNERPSLVIRYETDLTKYIKSTMSINTGDANATSVFKNQYPFPDAVISFTSDNKYIATVSSYGLVSGISVGITTIKVTVIEDGVSRTHNCTVTSGSTDPDSVNRSLLLDTLCSQGYLSENEIVRTGDGFYMSVIPIDVLCNRAGVSISATLSNSRKTSDMYLYSAGVGADIEDSIVLMNTDNTSNSRVSVSFIDFYDIKLINCLTNKTTESVLALQAELNRVLTQANGDNTILSNYFGSMSSRGAYLIAEVYVRKIVDNTFVNNQLTLASNVASAIENTAVHASNSMNGALSTYNNIQYVYNASNDKITISDVNNLTHVEKSVILMSHTGNTSFHAFATEIYIHAAGAYIDGLQLISSLNVADMSINSYINYAGYDDDILVAINITILLIRLIHANYTYSHATNRW